jgi:hypothetical protein
VKSQVSDTRPHRCGPRHNPGFGKIRSECGFSARNGRSGQNPNYHEKKYENAALARLVIAHGDLIAEAEAHTAFGVMINYEMQ